MILVDGEFAGAINRRARCGRGALQYACRRSRGSNNVDGARERHLHRIGAGTETPRLIFTGIDVIGNYLTEINVTSPTGIHEVKRFGGADIAALVWDAIEKRKAG
ncbi:MAG: hypothetical protein WDM89_08755 [Rhizomicrobium sp.]